MLIVRGGLAVDRASGPTILFDEHITTTERNHRLDSQCHSGFEDQSVTSATVVTNLRFLVHLTSDTMSHELANYAITGFLAVVHKVLLLGYPKTAV